MKQGRAQPGLGLAGCLAAIITCMAAAAATACPQTVYLTRIDPSVTSPNGYYRWLNVADQVYSPAYRAYYSYDSALVQVAYETASTVFSGILAAANLKPNFVYQIKLVGVPGTPSNEALGLAGRWWEQVWTDTSWTPGWNLNDKGDGTSPNPNDLTYYQRCGIPDPTSPTGKHYQYTGYVLFDYFITDSYGNAFVSFRADSSHHVLLKSPEALPDCTISVFDPDTSMPAYAIDYPPSIVSVWAEWERLPVGGIWLQACSYTCSIILTEESFHSYYPEGGRWAAAMGAPVQFTILPRTPVLSGDANRDCSVNVLDLLFIRARMGYDPTTSDNAQADINSDGSINILDLIHTRNQLGSTCPQ